MTSMLAWRRFVFALVLPALPLAGSSAARASETIEFAQAQPQAQPTPAPSPTPSAAPTPSADAQPAAVEPIGNVATVTGIATVIRDKNSYPLRVRDDIYLNDVVQTSSNSALGITFNDATTFNLSASAKITIDNYVYEDGGKQNSAIFDVGKGTVAFVAAAVAKTGDMKITTPTATLGIRGTTGVVDVPEGAAANRASNVNIKLYPDADGRVGHIDVDDRSSGARLGALTQAASGFAIRPGAATAGVMRFAAVPITIPAPQIARDRGFVSQVHLAQTAGRQIVIEQRDFRRANPTALSRIPRPAQPPQQQQLRPTTAPGQLPQRPDGQPRQDNRPGQQQPGTPGRQGTQQGAQPPQRQGQGQHGGAVQPGTPRAGQGQGQRQQGAGRPTGAPRAGQGTAPSNTPQIQPQRGGQIQPGGIVPPQPGGTPQPQAPRTGSQLGQPPAVQQPGGVQRQGGFQQRPPAAQRPAAPRKPAPAPKEKERR
ncbi:iron dicitrate transport regulator FecR [Bradyrhizobium sp. WBAH42]|nr:iron dicitrate transport regulator FecR [Bradyrhizobium sp. WBAH30]MDD1545273.1 iron dicitrate transport regulator FecR [Bradyrhizobium sp. WBAH41]MDD1558883.1 iron dicitrate transport regulator FecR [Bradyrhizobium sp. WBAH23]MDD1565962.1 iron dicitrate transport regulator FecR [Bradyrhizobium sp. WBAH33]MDD1591480.1 iron dicitrate transport regulator FecR [Bradyrhizobium sp. WBAH42]NRB89635.1 iron dicitrate transport regulator FecR [Bradyrhizobium sp. WBAH10]QCJ89694.1 iron dicitrate tra